MALLGGDYKRIYLGGFSQGCVIALASFLLYPDEQLGGVVGLSGAHKAIIDYENEVDMKLKKKTKIFLYHGKDDPLIPMGLATESYMEFTNQEHKLDVTFQSEAGMVHSLSQTELGKVAEFFGSLMV